MNRNASVFLTVVVFLAVLCSGCDALDTAPLPTRTEGPDAVSIARTMLAGSLPAPRPTFTPTPDATLEWILEETDYGKAGVYLIVDALNRFYADQGYYPEELSELVPEYLEQLPSTISGEPFNYFTSDSFIFGVTFLRDRREGTICGYFQIHELWECGFIDAP